VQNYNYLQQIKHSTAIVITKSILTRKPQRRAYLPTAYNKMQWICYAPTRYGNARCLEWMAQFWRYTWSRKLC